MRTGVDLAADGGDRTEVFELNPLSDEELARSRAVARELTKRWLKLGAARKRKLRSRGVTLIAVHPHYAVDCNAGADGQKRRRNKRKRERKSR